MPPMGDYQQQTLTKLMQPSTRERSLRAMLPADVHVGKTPAQHESIRGRHPFNPLLQASYSKILHQALLLRARKLPGSKGVRQAVPLPAAVRSVVTS